MNTIQKWFMEKYLDAELKEMAKTMAQEIMTDTGTTATPDTVAPVDIQGAETVGKSTDTPSTAAPNPPNTNVTGDNRLDLIQKQIEILSARAENSARVETPPVQVEDILINNFFPQGKGK